MTIGITTTKKMTTMIYAPRIELGLVPRFFFRILEIQQKRFNLRFQNRTRDLSITTNITVERDKPTTPSGGMRARARLVICDAVQCKI
jgi:hypothetical protein